MATNLDYAILAANVYANSAAVRHPRNVLPNPAGWARLSVSPANILVSGATSSGFMASAHRNGNEIVISYGGTTFEKGAIGHDWIYGNVPAATGIVLAPQVREAAQFYLDVMRSLSPAERSTVQVSFTGHSLGGGLATLMSVYFNRPASVFDAAPFEKSADSTTVVSALDQRAADARIHERGAWGLHQLHWGRSRRTFGFAITSSSTGKYSPHILDWRGARDPN